MKRVLLQFKSDSFGSQLQKMVTPEMSDQDADNLMLVLAKTKRVELQNPPGKYSSKDEVYVSYPAAGISSSIIESGDLMTARDMALRESEYKAAEADRAKAKALATAE